LRISQIVIGLNAFLFSLTELDLPNWAATILSVLIGFGVGYFFYLKKLFSEKKHKDDFWLYFRTEFGFYCAYLEELAQRDPSKLIAKDDSALKSINDLSHNLTTRINNARGFIEEGKIQDVLNGLEFPILKDANHPTHFQLMIKNWEPIANRTWGNEWLKDVEMARTAFKAIDDLKKTGKMPDLKNNKQIKT